ncbi:zinc ribbon domain-containing protein [Spirilliplanes yamanashiensis]|uniref:Zinc ribbon domain-containing protein n=1 Tax=Spirilliplanes yamanashiensis TaxID=42233 RepID=A0A8J3Y827_9ACTN|nr:zinc ribbon domain-containing protein [Spirilliplanes yamanashiensis]MDP9815441.1 hypothetical protein [Spirilliplanes yamanashiensis]GIJ03696.1 zinc ribbon domain-containing protein [Spirilliplanes yamanashiensis]
MAPGAPIGAGAPGGVLQQNPAALVAPETTPAAAPQPRAAAAPARTAAGPAAGGEPDVVAPQDRPQARRAVPKSAPSRRLEEGDLVCGECGEGNLPTRRFCSRCGDSLAHAEAVRPRWWKRILPRRKPRRAEVAAPAADGKPERVQRRQHRRSVWPVIRRSLAVLILVCGLLYAAFPQVRSFVDPRVKAGRAWVQSALFPDYAPVRAVTATGPVSDRKHPPVMAADGFTNTWWSAPVAKQKMIELKFQEPVEPKRTLIRGGIVGDLRGSQRPRTLHLVWPTGRTQDLVLKDHTDGQEFDLDSGGPVTSVQVWVQDTYQNVESKNVAITEIELWSEKKD